MKKSFFTALVLLIFLNWGCANEYHYVKDISNKISSEQSFIAGSITSYSNLPIEVCLFKEDKEAYDSLGQGYIFKSIERGKYTVKIKYGPAPRARPCRSRLAGASSPRPGVPAPIPAMRSRAPGLRRSRKAMALTLRRRQPAVPPP